MKPTTLRLPAAATLAAASLAAFSASTLSGANLWDGGGSSANWSDTFNWDDDATPGYGTITFAGSTQTTNTVDTNVSQNVLLWTGSSNWTLSSSGGSTVSLYDNGGSQAKVENQSTGVVTINAPITFAATAGAAWGEINAVNGGLSFGSGTLTVDGSAVAGIRMFGAGQTTTFNNTVSAAGKYFATTAASAGTVAIGGAFSSGDFYLMNGSTLQLTSGGTLATTGLRLGGDFGTTGAQNLALGATFQLTNSTGGQTFSSNINTVTGNTSGALLVDSQNTSGTNTLSSNIFLDSGLRFQQADGGTLVLSGIVSNAGGLTKLGAGTLTLSGVNTFTGGTTLSAGTLNINNAAALGNTATGGLTISGTSTINNTSGAAITTTAAKALTLGGDLTFTGSNNLSTNLGAVTISGSTRTLNVAGGTLTTGLINSAAGIGLTKTGSGTYFMANTANTSNIGGTLDVQGGKVLTSGDLTVGGLSGSGNVENGGPNSKWFFVNQAGNTSYSGAIKNLSPTVKLGLVKTGAGTLTLSGASDTNLDTFRVQGGSVVLAAGSIGGTPDVLIGNGAANPAALIVTGGSFVGNAATAIGGSSGAYAALNVSGGTLSSGTWMVVGGSNDRGVLNQSGGTITVNTNRITIGAGNNVSIGVASFSGGTFTSAGGAFVGENGTGTLNISGTAAVNLGDTKFANNATSVAGNINLLGGSLNTASITKGTGSGVYRLNFNGGTVKATTAGTLMASLANTTAYVNSPGGTINNNGLAISFAQPLLAPTGNGLATVPVSAGGSGYVDTPVVTITGGGGTGATAVANVSGGVVTGITITNPGVGYTSAPTIALIGGLGSGATVGTATISANVSGGMTFSGTGTTTLTGVHTYTGGTTVSAGTLVLGTGGSAGTLRGVLNISSGATVNATAVDALGYSGGTEVTAINVNGGTFNNSVAGNNAYRTQFNLTGGTVSSSGGGALNFTNGFGVSSLASATTSTVSAPIAIRDTNNLPVSAALGTTSSGIDLALSGVISGPGLSLTKTGSGRANLTGVNTHTGTTTVSAGTLGLGSTGSLAAASSLDVQAGATFDVRNGLGSRAQSITNLTLGGGSLVFGMVGGSTDNLTATGTVSVSGLNTITLFGSANSGNYNLISGTSALSDSNFTLNTSNLVTGFTSYVGAVSGNNYILSVTANPTPATAYWLGGISAVWGGNSGADSNWSTDLAGSTNAQQIPGGTSDVVFSATGAGNTSTTLGADFTIKSLSFASATSTINAGNTLGIIGANPNGHALEVANGATANVDVATTYVGSTKVQSGGTLNTTSSTLGGVTNSFDVDGTLNANGSSLTIGSLSGSGVVSRSVSGSGSLIAGASGNSTFSGSLQDGSGSLSLNKAGSGTLTLTGANTHTGGTTVTAGILALGDGGSLPGSVSVSTGGAFGLAHSSAATVSNNISGAGALAKSGSAVSTYTGTATNTGGINVSAGTLANAGSLSGSAVTVTGGTFQNTTGSLTTAVDLNVANGAGLTGTLQIDGGTVNQTAGIIFAGRNGGTGTFNVSGGTVTTPGIRLAVDGTGSIGTGLITGGSINNTGEFWVANGAASNVGTLGVSAGSLTVNNWLAVGRLGGIGTINQSGGTITKTGNTGNFVIIGSLAGTGTLNQTGGIFDATAGGIRLGENNGNTPSLGSSWTISGNSTSSVSGEVNVAWRSSEATWNIQDNAAVNVTGRLIVGGETSAAGAVGGAVVAGRPVGIVNQSGGTVTFTGGDNRIGGDNSAVSNLASGTVNVSGGTMNFGGNLQIGAYGVGAMNITGTGTVNSTGGFPGLGRYAGSNGTLTVNGGTFNQTNASASLIVGEEGTGTLNLTSGLVDVQQINVGHAATGNGTVNLDGGVLATKLFSKPNGSSTAAISLNGGTIRSKADAADLFSGFSSGAITVASGGASFDTNGFNITVTQDLAGPGGLTKGGSGTLTLNGSNTYAGTTSLNGGTTKAGSSTAFSSGAITLATGATLDLNGQSIANPITNNGGTIVGSAGNANIAQNGGTLSGTVGGTITASGSVGGTATITGTLKGNAATFTGAITFNNGSTHAPGNSPGFQTFTSGVTYNTGSTLEIEFVGNTLAIRGTDFDGVDVTGGDLTIQSGAILKLIDLGSLITYAATEWDSVRNFTIVDSSGGGTTSGDFTLDTSLAGSFGAQGNWTLLTASGLNGDTILTWTPVPEPSTYAALAGLAVLGLAWKRRRQRLSNISNP